MMTIVLQVVLVLVMVMLTEEKVEEMTTTMMMVDGILYGYDTHILFLNRNLIKYKTVFRK